MAAEVCRTYARRLDKANGRGGTIILESAWPELANSLGGTVIRPGDRGYDDARALQIREFDVIHPVAVVFCADTEDVRRTIRFARRHGLPVAVRSGGHSCAGYSTTEGIVLDVSSINAVRRDGRSVRVGAGIQTIDLHAATLPDGWVVPAGLCPSVGLAGLALGGGMGLATRKYGTTSDRVREITVVLADGTVVTCDHDRHADLFWALRGCGGGNIGVATEFVLEAVPAEAVTSYSLRWDWRHAARVWSAWQDWAPHAPDDLSSNLRFALEHPGPDDEPQVLVAGAWLGAQAELPPLLEDLQASVGASAAERFEHRDSHHATLLTWMGCADLTVAQAHRIGVSPEAVLPRDGWHRERGHFVTQSVPAEGIEQILAEFAKDRAPNQIRALELGAMGGACNRIPADATAFAHRDHLYYAGLVAEAHDEITDELRLSGSTWIDICQAVLRRWSSPYSYQNLPDPALADWRRAYYGDNYPRLVEVARRYDPDGFFRHPQSLNAPASDAR